MINLLASKLTEFHYLFLTRDAFEKRKGHVTSPVCISPIITLSITGNVTTTHNINILTPSASSPPNFSALPLEFAIFPPPQSISDLSMIIPIQLPISATDHNAHWQHIFSVYVIITNTIHQPCRKAQQPVLSHLRPLVTSNADADSHVFLFL